MYLLIYVMIQYVLIRQGDIGVEGFFDIPKVGYSEYTNEACYSVSLNYRVRV